jgi:hypothetical protein
MGQWSLFDATAWIEFNWAYLFYPHTNEMKMTLWTPLFHVGCNMEDREDLWMGFGVWGSLIAFIPHRLCNFVCDIRRSAYLLRPARYFLRRVREA